jgi:hypothetical protein
MVAALSPICSFETVILDPWLGVPRFDPLEDENL